jgi:serine/threonine-protein kinase RsbW
MSTDRNSMQLATIASMANLPDLLALAERACDAAGVDDETRYRVRLLVEEVCVNVVSHGYPAGQPGPIELDIESTAEWMTIRISDKAETFRPEDAPAPDLESDWQERSAGGLGWHLVRSLSDELHHASVPGGGNRYTMTTRIRATRPK